jgi:hypothetical protein
VVKPLGVGAHMLTVQSEGKFLVPLVLCEVCHEQVKGEGSMWTLACADGQPRTGEAYFSHKDCQGSFGAQNPAPPGWKWARADTQAFLTLLAENTKDSPEKTPMVKGPRIHGVQEATAMETFPNVTELIRLTHATRAARMGSIAQQAAAALVSEYFDRNPGQLRGWLVYNKKNYGGLLFLVGPLQPSKKRLTRVAHILGVAEVPPLQELRAALLTHGPEGLRFDGVRVTRAGH